MSDVRLVALFMIAWGAGTLPAGADPATGSSVAIRSASADARPIRVILPAPWEPSSPQPRSGGTVQPESPSK